MLITPHSSIVVEALHHRQVCRLLPLCLCVPAAEPFRPFVLLMLFDVVRVLYIRTCICVREDLVCEEFVKLSLFAVAIALADWRLTLDRDKHLYLHIKQYCKP